MQTEVQCGVDVPVADGGFTLRRRREREIQEYRVAERERQRACRERRRQSGDPGRSTGPPSRTSLTAQPVELHAEILARWDRQMHLSRANLARQLGKMMREPSVLVGQETP